MRQFGIGQPIRRVEDRRFLTGNGRYLDDIVRPRQVHAAMLRSPRPHARISAIRAGAARALPGVAAVITADDLGAVGRIPVRIGQRAGVGPNACLQPPLATGLVRYVGEPIAFVVADSRYLAEDAAELIEIDWEPLPVVADVRRATEAGAPVLHPAAGGNIIERLSARAGHVESGLAAGGMVPKLRAAAEAARGGVEARILNGNRKGALEAAVAGERVGTVISEGVAACKQ